MSDAECVFLSNIERHETESQYHVNASFAIVICGMWLLNLLNDKQDILCLNIEVVERLACSNVHKT